MTPADSVERPDGRRFPEKLDDLQAAHPFLYNVTTGTLVGLVGLLFGFAWPVAPLYALSYGLVRWYLWGDHRILRRQYEARKIRTGTAHDEP